MIRWWEHWPVAQWQAVDWEAYSALPPSEKRRARAHVGRQFEDKRRAAQADRLRAQGIPGIPDVASPAPPLPKSKPRPRDVDQLLDRLGIGKRAAMGRTDRQRDPGLVRRTSGRVLRVR